MIRTAITDMFGIEAPIVMGGMTGVGYAPLVAAVANAGGLGFITAHHSRTADDLADEIGRCRAITDRPFGVNLTLLPSFDPIPYDEYCRAIVDCDVRIVETAGRSPADYLPFLKANGVKVIHKCTSVRHAVTAEKLGVDVVSIDGFECAGHPGEDDVGLIVLLPATVDAVRVPVIASGGMADGRSLAAALALGAEGVNMGTRFMATKESGIHENIKRHIVSSTERDTMLINRTLHNTSRVARNAVSQKVVEIQRNCDLGIDAVRDLVSGARARAEVIAGGNVDGGAWAVGQSQGLIQDIPDCNSLVDTIVSQASKIMTSAANRIIRTAA
ncbi:NAD(P)H-dependent flavin oxidoreductase [Sphingopyxis sp. 550A]